MAGSVRIEGNALLMGGGVQVRFIRTLRLPESGTHPLPPGIGEFPLRRIEDCPGPVPEEWRARGGVILPVYLREAMWLSFAGTREPAALQIGVGKVCAVSGERWTGRLARRPQNYVVLPRQPWLDGINSGSGTVRQFVAVPLGLGATVEGQVTGEETTGGVQLQAFPLSGPRLAAWREEQRPRAAYGGAPAAPGGPGGPVPGGGAVPMPAMPPMPPLQAMAPGGYGAPPPPGAPAPARAAAPAAMGLGVGGSMKQEVYQDERPLSDWSADPAGRVFVHLVTPPEWQRITGEPAPPSPVDRAAYTRAGLPWFDYYDEDGTDLAPSDTLGQVKPVGDWLGEDHTPWVPPVPGQVQPLGDQPGKPVADGTW
ncbi:hypothetical protein DEJ50_02400 [Streptomyces venezuelae]|uniref:Integral membrane protein n=1 Tax=Streptomyces venezuelae TaxID=54571 RepID=A0A5P2CWR3_STRVZ|nr:hypothetical protein [Streptomyces venezuelae]QES46873.1 hypothetical protein DEJ50_02400 [Streptomyces venezuelae]